MNNKYDALKIENQICFPLYACSREVIKLYKPYLDELDLTYTQYITMMILWDKRKVTVKELGNCLYLDSGTLTPLLKKMEAKGLLTRARSREDERNLIITVTEKGDSLSELAADIPMKIGRCIDIEPEEARELYRVLYKILTRTSELSAGED